jgi:TolA-binding protein
MTNAQLDAELMAMQIDHRGRHWMIGANSGQWYVHDGATWSPATPPSEPAAVPSRQTAAPSRPSARQSGRADHPATPPPSPSPGGAPPAAGRRSRGATFTVDTPQRAVGPGGHQVGFLEPGIRYTARDVAPQGWVLVDTAGGPGWVDGSSVRVLGPQFGQAPTTADPKATYNQARRLEQRGRLDAARADYRTLVDSPDRWVAASSCCNLGNLLRRQGDLTGARMLLERSLQLDIADVVPAASYNLAMVLEALGDKTGARSAYQRTLDTAKPGDPVHAAARLRRDKLRLFG